MQQRCNRLAHGLIHIQAHGYKQVVKSILGRLRLYCPDRHKNTFAPALLC
jgi:hypothetical protein